MDLTGALTAITDGATASLVTIGPAVLVFTIGMRMWKRSRGVA